ncbi:MAG TPA: isochorismatase family cysteine hydrolase [Candidatus Nanoarchaeia archaeon]|nr:isochorismatase family cysteine hydrolase [Candidatus Nanoarchaeia archaeon]
MLKEDYLTSENCSNKIIQWGSELQCFQKRWKPFTLQHTALLVIDMQNYFLDDKSHAFVPSSRHVLKNVLQLISLFRNHSQPIIFTYFAIAREADPIGNWWGDTVREDSFQSQIFPAFRPRENEYIFRKSTYDSFYRTELETILRSSNIKHVVVAGVLSNLCCETTARQAFIRNFSVFFALDATAAYTEEMHLATLKNISYGFATPISTREMLQ